MTNYQKWDDGVRFGLSWQSSAYPCDDSMGTGGCQHIMRFESAEGREYYIQARTYEDAMNSAARELEWFKAALADCFTPSGRVRRKRLMQLAGRKI